MPISEIQGYPDFSMRGFLQSGQKNTMLLRIDEFVFAGQGVQDTDFLIVRTNGQSLARAVHVHITDSTYLGSVKQVALEL